MFLLPGLGNSPSTCLLSLPNLTVSELELRRRGRPAPGGSASPTRRGRSQGTRAKERGQRARAQAKAPDSGAGKGGQGRVQIRTGKGNSAGKGWDPPDLLFTNALSRMPLPARWPTTSRPFYPVGTLGTKGCLYSWASWREAVDSRSDLSFLQLSGATRPLSKEMVSLSLQMSRY